MEKNSPSAVYEQLKDAHRQGRVVGVIYRGEPRVFAIHALGWNRRGAERCHVWQFAGTSRQGNLPGWRCFDVAQMQGLLLGDTADKYPHYQPPARSERAPSCLDSFDQEVLAFESAHHGGSTP